MSQPSRPVRRGPQTRNQSKGAGAPAPASKAATAAQFYDPESGGPSLADRLRAVSPEHVAEVQRQAVEVDEHTTADVAIAQAVEREEVAEDEILRPRFEEKTDDPRTSLPPRGAIRSFDEPVRDETSERAAAAASLEVEIQRIRAFRQPLGEYTQKLALPPRPGYKTHWFNDEGGRIDDALANGWAPRKDKDGKPYRRAVGRGRDDGVTYAYAMVLPEVFWLEDMQAKHNMATAKMDALKAGPFKAPSGAAKASDQGKFYSPVEDREPLTIEKR